MTTEPMNSGAPPSVNKPPILVVEIGEPVPRQMAKRLRKGRGELMHRVRQVADEFVESGMLKPDGELVVIVLREKADLLFGFG